MTALKPSAGGVLALRVISIKVLTIISFISFLIFGRRANGPWSLLLPLERRYVTRITIVTRRSIYI